ncbi:expressed unknown protein [Seminavis robusta]|uniref:Nucleolar protein 16 n=1 Tax=Seminavis robusta TaxID=568900 RepID=A0A9N8HR03_9STRA|nr:expressed unknown protein [Seminavis robusta]|eukprot:Sro1032_g233580.1 n/a (192) ;mRNA; r:25754-26329
MVKHGRSKKRRSGRIGRVKLKNKNFKRWDPNPNIKDATVQKLWDTTKTPTQNLAQMGLNVSFNNIHNNNNNSTSTSTTTTTPNMIELFDVPTIISNETKRLPLQPDEQEYILRGITKYGTHNYKALFRDVKLNVLQHTQQKLETMGTRFLALQPEQIRLATTQTIPKTILDQMAHGTEIQQQIMQQQQEQE